MSSRNNDEPTVDYDDDAPSEGMEHLEALLSELTDADRDRLEPPQSIWNAIVDTVSADRDGDPDRSLGLLDDDLGGHVGADFSSIEEQATTTIVLARARPTVEPTLPSDDGSWRRQWLPVAAAVAVAVVGGLATWALSDEIAGNDAGNSPTAVIVGEDAEVVAVIEIINDGLPVAAPEPAEVRLIRSGQQHFLELDVPDLPDVEGYYELWITDPEVEGAVSLGVVVGDGLHALPPGIDTGDYPMVDVSVEATDGDPTHSSRSVWRGRLAP